jgi:hypothetical protein
MSSTKTPPHALPVFLNNIEDKDFSSIASTLACKGCVSIPLFTATETEKWHSLLYREMEHFPEFKTPPTLKGKSDRFSLGAFGAMGTPSSFHNGVVRSLRIFAYRAVRPLLRALTKNDKNMQSLRLAAIVDRLCLRMKGDSLGGESMHRDVSKKHRADNLIFGGWINIEPSVDTFFSYKPGSHLTKDGKMWTGDEHGFATIPREDYPKHRPHFVKKKVRPGHLVIFYSHIIHEVNPGLIMQNQLRLFTSWHLTTDREPIHGDSFDRVLRTQAVCPLPSGEMSFMFSTNHYRFHDMLVSYSSQFVKGCLKTIDSDRFGQWSCVYRILPSLKKLGLPLFPSYCDEECKLYKPTLLHKIKRIKRRKKRINRPLTPIQE